MNNLMCLIFIYLGIEIIGIILVSMWIYKDAKSRGKNPFWWILLTCVVSPHFLGVIIYFLVRKTEKLTVCSHCSAKVQKPSNFCPNCGQKMENAEIQQIQPPTATKLIAGIVLIVVSIILTFVTMFVKVVGDYDNDFNNKGFIPKTVIRNKYRADFLQMNGTKTLLFKAKTNSDTLYCSSEIVEGEIDFKLYNYKDSLIAQIPVNKDDTLRNFVKGESYILKINAKKARGKINFKME